MTLQQTIRLKEQEINEEILLNTIDPLDTSDIDDNPFDDESYDEEDDVMDSMFPNTEDRDWE